MMAAMCPDEAGLNVHDNVKGKTVAAAVTPRPGDPAGRR
jgi:hypothetical protein